MDIDGPLIDGLPIKKWVDLSTGCTDLGATRLHAALQVLPPRPAASLARATSKAAPRKPMPEDFDLGPFNDLLPPKPGAAGVGGTMGDLGVFF